VNQERTRKGLKPHVVEMIARRRIDGACNGENAWDDFIKGHGHPIF
jgi:hypothetical protein